MKKVKRTILSLFLALTLLCSIAAPASAAGCNTLRCRVGRVVQYLRCSWMGNCKTPAPEAPTEPEVPTEPETPPVKPETPAQPLSQQDSTALAYEKAVAELVNQQRAAYGLKPLTLSEDLCAKARIKSRDMAEGRYFSHNSPTYGSPFDMMRSLGISYNTAGENIAMGYATPEAVVNAWMNSEGHRANILSARYTTIGVGYIASGNYWTQWFLG